MYKLFIDDERIPVDCLEFTSNEKMVRMYQQPDWIILRTFQQMVDYISLHSLPQFISFDHDLADGIGEDEKTGLTCVKWLIGYCIDNDKKFPSYVIHSQNNVGPENMESWIKNFNKMH